MSTPTNQLQTNPKPTQSQPDHAPQLLGCRPFASPKCLPHEDLSQPNPSPPNFSSPKQLPTATPGPSQPGDAVDAASQPAN